ncbi:pentraxin-related protein PTX3-like isoform X1 [Sinocyclocheilus grahami]|uniref:Pentraxin-related protein PTX3 n=1 Tax=Sinocyclocheilus grahami TaxID=75366 RepID=A0A672PEL3_SINGR|nr:PREDICTED: pentraxin-related protein PTX3-like isoform X1 [Sinocyclocheilus grahami]
MQGQTNIHTSINIRMYAPGAVLVLCLPCFLSGNVFGYEYGEDYSDSYYNEISNGERLQTGATQIPCPPQDFSRWDKLFIMLEDSQMKQDMLLHQNEDMVKVETDSIRKELHKLNNSKACIQASENTCKCISEQMNRNLNQAMKQLREAADNYQAQNNETLQQLIQFSRNQATRLTKLESSSLLGAGLGQVAMKSFSAYPKEQEASNADGGKLERALMATVADLQRVHAQLALFQRAAAHRFLPSGCEMALLFPMRSKHIFAEVTPSMSMSLQSFTICLWAKVTQSLNKTVLLSYGTKKNPQELQLLLARHSVLLTVGGETHLVEAHSVVTDGQWGHVCAAWSSEQGLAALWVNGENVARVPGVAEGHVLPSNGLILLGQERSRSGVYRDLDSSVAFTGKMTGVNMWDHVLDAGRIKEYANQDGSCDSRGNVIGWGVSEIIPHGGSQYIN